MAEREASEFLKALAHDKSRLMILCDLLHGERSVGELEALLSRRHVRCCLKACVSARRDGKTIYYSIASDKARSIMAHSTIRCRRRTGPGKRDGAGLSSDERRQAAFSPQFARRKPLAHAPSAA